MQLELVLKARKGLVNEPVDVAGNVLVPCLATDPQQFCYKTYTDWVKLNVENSLVWTNDEVVAVMVTRTCQQNWELCFQFAS